MEGEDEGIPPAAAAPIPSPPLHDDRGPNPVDEVAESQIQAALTDEDLDTELELEHDNDNDEHDHDHALESGASVDDLKLKIIKQVEYYFSDDNLHNGKYLLGCIKKNKENFALIYIGDAVPISVIASFRKMKKLTRDHSFIVAALRESSLLVVSGDGKMVERLNPIRFSESRDSKLYTVLVENLPEDHSKENIRRIFSEAGNIKSISIQRPRPHAIVESTKHSKREMFISTRLHAFVEYETTEAAEKAVATLNDEKDWRNGMRVKLLKRMGKYGHQKQARKGSDSERNDTTDVSQQTGDEENQTLNERNENTHDEEDRVHLSKDKSGQRCRHRGRARKHNYRGTNGLGHGNTLSTHAVEASKRPPGPKMPDGTRGFAMGRGRPPVSIPN